MDSWKEVTLGDITKALIRYRPFIVAVVAIALVAFLLPGHGDRKQNVSAAAANRGASTGLSDTATTVAAAADAGTSGLAAAGGAGGLAGNVGGDASGTITLPSGAKVGPDCDLATGRIK